MIERPILFKPEMVRAILAGRKTQTRRLYVPRYPEPYEVVEDGVPHQCGEDGVYHRRADPYGVPGDRLWIKETWAVDESLDLQKPSNLAPGIDMLYLADGHRVKPARSFDRGKTRVSIFMPRWASRITLPVEDVRVERLQDISVEDAIAEGIDPAPHRCDCDRCRQTSQLCPATSSSLIMEYAALWMQINGPTSWDANPLVWKIAFPKLTANATKQETNTDATDDRNDDDRNHQTRNEGPRVKRRGHQVASPCGRRRDSTEQGPDLGAPRVCREADRDGD